MRAVEEKEGSRGGWRYKYLEQEGESKMCHSPSSVCFSVLLLHLKFTWRHGERWMDGEREKAREMEKCVAAHSRAKSTLTAFPAERRVMSASSLCLFISVFLCIPSSRLHFNFLSIYISFFSSDGSSSFSYSYSRI